MSYASRTTYRRPARWRRIVNGVVAWMAATGLTPSDTVCLEVVGRKTGKLHQFAVTMAIQGGDRYLVSLAGESEWVRNLRAAGRAFIRHGHRTMVRVEELPLDQRAAVLKAYLAKRALSKSAAAAARDYFGVPVDPSLQDLQRIAVHYPVFRVTDLHE